MNRRSFLSIIAGSGGSCLIPVAIARRIRDVCLGNSQPLILAPERFSFDLHAEECFGRYTLHLGDPNEEPDYPTLREFVEDKGFSPDNRRSLRDYLINWRGHDVLSEGRTSPVIDELVTMLDEPIDGYERSHWMDWDALTGWVIYCFHRILWVTGFSGLPKMTSIDTSLCQKCVGKAAILSRTGK